MTLSKVAVSVRPARADDVDDLHRILVSAFGHPAGSERWELRRRQAQEWQPFFVLEREGEPIGAVRIGTDRLRFGQAGVLTKGDVGHVSIRRDLQGQGLGTQLMRETVRIMEEQGFHLSRLGGRAAFYARFGWVPFPRRSYEFPLEALRARTAPEVGTLASATAHLRPYDPGRDWEERWRLYDRFHAGLTGSLVEPRPPRGTAPGAVARCRSRQSAPPPPPAGRPDTTGLRWVYEVGGSLCAYAFARQGGGDVAIDDAAGDLDHPGALGAVLQRALWEAARGGAERGVGRLPFDGRVEAAMVEGAVSFVTHELQTAPDSNMLRLISLRRLAGVCAPEWSRRLQEVGGTPWAGVLELRVQDEAVRLALASDGAEIASEPERSDARLEIPPRAFLLALLGYRSWQEVAFQARGEIPPGLAPTLGILFPRGSCATGALG